MKIRLLRSTHRLSIDLHGNRSVSSSSCFGMACCRNLRSGRPRLQLGNMNQSAPVVGHGGSTTVFRDPRPNIFGALGDRSECPVVRNPSALNSGRIEAQGAVRRQRPVGLASRVQGVETDCKIERIPRGMSDWRFLADQPSSIAKPATGNRRPLRSR